MDAAEVIIISQWEAIGRSVPLMNGALVLPLRSDQRVFSIMMTKIVRIGGSGCAEAERAEAHEHQQ